MGSDVVLSMQDFFWIGLLMPNLNLNIIVFIPKVLGAYSLGDFCSITLANFQFKTITNILRNMLAQITMRIISVNHRGFIRDRTFLNL